MVIGGVGIGVVCCCIGVIVVTDGGFERTVETRVSVANTRDGIGTGYSRITDTSTLSRVESVIVPTTDIS
ncbi:hypothetical protein Tco_1526619 [Tanacetum coccineum]